MTTFEREDWTDFRTLGTLGRKAGVTQEAIPALVVKELVDNALDEDGRCRYGQIGDGGFYVANDGNGLPKTDEKIAALFSVARPLSSSKLLRLPTRGALGNGLRVVVGAVLASGGQLTVKTGGRALCLRPRAADGMTEVESVKPWTGKGTRIEVVLGQALPVDDSTFRWARQADAMAQANAKTYKGLTSPFWYDVDSFYELTQAAGARPVRQLVESFAGCSGAKAGKLASDFTGRVCDSLTKDEAETLLVGMRSGCGEVNPKRLGTIGPQFQPDAGYARAVAAFQLTPADRKKVAAQLPAVVEVWARPAESPSIVAYVNRTPITGELHISRCFPKEKTLYGITGCGLSREHKHTAFAVKAGRGREYAIILNVTTPYMPITTDGKAPDLSVVDEAIETAIEKAIRGAKRKNVNGNGQQTYQNAIIIDALPTAIEKVSGNGKYRYSLRQLFYAVRPCLLEALGMEPKYNYFSQVVTDYEAEQGHDLPGMYRDDRGTLYHPHTGEYISLGTRSVEAYQRPPWTFSKILYCEKEGFFATMIDAQWPERHDCALLTSKGYASRAARDVLDLLGDGDEPLTFYCLHDADGPGTMIYQTLQEGTRARIARRVEIVNLGLEPAEAVDMGLPIEPVKRKDGKRVPVANYVDGKWTEWLQKHRVELNAMDTPTFLEWLDGKIPTGKLIPPADVVADRLLAETAAVIRRRLIDAALLQARIDERTAEALESLHNELQRTQTRLTPSIEKKLAADPSLPWTSPVVSAAAKVAGKMDRDK
jgi:hypothetical protein